MTKEKLSYWIMLILGTTLNTFQVYKYVTNQLEYSMLELIILIVGVAFNFAPKRILTIFEKTIIKRNE